MIREDKELLLKDLCARLPYGVKVKNTSFSEPQIHTLFGRVSDDEFLMLETYKSVAGEDYRRVTDDVHYTGYLESIKPYLRPMSSMTKKEQEEFVKFHCVKLCPIVITDFLSIENEAKMIDWLNAHQFDYRKTSDGKTMIEAGLALEAPDGMYS